MPYGDGTGPAGMGPMTGRAGGYCAGYPVPGYLNPIPGRGFVGFGRGRYGGGGRGWRHWYYATGLPGWARAQMGYPARGAGGYPGAVYPYAPEITPQQEAEMLKKQAQGMQEEINIINERINELAKLAQDKEKSK